MRSKGFVSKFNDFTGKVVNKYELEPIAEVSNERVQNLMRNVTENDCRIGYKRIAKQAKYVVIDETQSYKCVPLMKLIQDEVIEIDFRYYHVPYFDEERWIRNLELLD